MWRAAWWWLPLVATAVAFATTLGFDLVADARFLVADNPLIRDLGGLWDNMAHDYFWSASGNAIPYWRPLTKASWVLEFQAFGGWAGGYHLVNVLWHLAGVAGVLALGRRLGLARPWAAVAGLLYGLNPVSGEPVCLVMARSDVAAAGATVWALVLWDRWVGGGRWRALAGLVAAAAVALGSKEVAVIIGPVLLVWAWVAGTLADAGRRRRAALGLGLVGVLTGAYLITRGAVLAGYDRPALTVDPLRIIAGGGRALAALVPFRWDSGLRNLPRAEAATTLGWAVGAGLWAFVLGAASWAAWRRRPGPALALAWLVASLAPILLVATVHVPGVQGKIPLADRWALQAAMAASLGWALLGARALGARGAPRPEMPGLETTGEQETDARRPWAPKAPKALKAQNAVWAAVGLWAAGALAIAPVAHGVYASETDLLAHEDAQLQATPREYWTQEDVCRALDRQLAKALAEGRGDAAAQLAHGAPAACLSEPDFAFNAASAALAGGRAAEARGLAERLLARPGGDRRHVPRAHVIAGVAALRAGAAGAALDHLDAGLRGGVSWCEVGGERAQALSRLGRHEEAAQALERLAERCLPPPRAAVAWLGAAQEWTQAAPAQPQGDARVRRALRRAASLAPPGSTLARQVRQLQTRLGAGSR